MTWPGEDAGEPALIESFLSEEPRLTPYRHFLEDLIRQREHVLADGDVLLDDRVTVFDTVYTPARTPLIREAEARGARVVTGMDMFIGQAARQFALWTGKAAPVEVFRELLRRA